MPDNNINSNIEYNVNSIYRFEDWRYEHYRQAKRHSDNELEIVEATVICELYQSLYN